MDDVNDNHVAEEELFRYCADLSDDTEKESIGRHIEACDECAQRLKQWQAEESFWRSTPDTSHLPDILARIKEKVAQSKKQVLPFPPKKKAFSANNVLTFVTGIAAIAVITVSTFIAIGPQIKNMFTNTVDANTVGKNQAVLSETLY